MGATDTTIKITKSDLNLDSGATALQGTEIGALLGTVYTVAAFVAIIAIVIGGIRYTTSNGDATNIKAAKDTILYAVVGLLVVMMAAAITDFVIKNVAK